MNTNIITKIFGSKYDRDVKKIVPLIDQINEYNEEFKNLDEQSLIAKTDEFKQRIKNDETHLEAINCV